MAFHHLDSDSTLLHVFVEILIELGAFPSLFDGVEFFQYHPRFLRHARRAASCKMIHSDRADVENEVGRDGSLGPCAPQAPGSDENSAGVEAWKHALPDKTVCTLAPVDIGSPAESCDSRMTDASVLSSIGTLVAAAASDGGEDAWDWLVDTSGDQHCATQRPDTVDRALTKGQPIQRTLAARNLKKGSSAVTKASAKRAQIASGIPERSVQTYLPLGMMAAALKRDLDERKLLEQHKNRTKVKKTVFSTNPIAVPDGTVMGTPWA